ncbi:MAG: hypothetical protein JRD89_18015 [Deltaproteobacteria bacterium]|nr:hypothetical protein [Deltaproteobacteria bacterium]
MGEEVPRSELTRVGLEMVILLRAVAMGIARSPQLEGWTKGELDGTADMIMEDLRTDDPEGIALLRRLYQETGGQPIKEVRYE